MKKIFFVFVLVSLMTIPAWSITGIKLGVHGGRAIGFKYNMLNKVISELAQENHWIKNSPDKALTQIGGHINADILHLVDISGFADYAWDKTKINSSVNLKLSDFSYGLSIIKKFGLPFADPYIGAGLAWHKFVYSLEAPGDDILIALPDDQTRPGYHLLAGVEANIPVFPLSPFAEYRYNWINTKDEKTTFSCLSLGISLKF
jgi:opacity protein-like surface antigen